MKISFDFDPCSHDDMQEMKRMVYGYKYFDLLHEIDQSLRSKLKYNDLKGWPSDAVNFLQELRDEINDEVDFSE